MSPVAEVDRANRVLDFDELMRRGEPDFGDFFAADRDELPTVIKAPRGPESEPYFVVEGLRHEVEAKILAILSGLDDLTSVLDLVVERLSTSGFMVLRKKNWAEENVASGLQSGSLQYFTQRELVALVDKKKSGLGITGGGDAPGIAPCISGFVSSLKGNRLLLGVGNAGAGLAVSPEQFLDHLIIMEKLIVRDIRGQSSTPFGSARIDLMNGAHANLIENIKRFGFLFGTGGNGNMALMQHLAELFPDMTVVGTFKSIDGDATIDGQPAQMLGFDTAVRTYRKSIYDVAQSSFAHQQVSVIEVFGRGSGRLAFESARRDPADLRNPNYGNNSVRETYRKIEEFGRTVLILVPEKPVSVADLVEEVRMRRARYGNRSCVIVASEQFKFSDAEFANSKVKVREILAAILKSNLDIPDVKVAFESYEARGAAPSKYDRLMGEKVGIEMARLVNNGEVGGQAVVYLEGMDPAKERPRVMPLKGVSDGHNLNNKELYPDEMLRKGGVFWKE